MAPPFAGGPGTAAPLELPPIVYARTRSFTPYLPLCQLSRRCTPVHARRKQKPPAPSSLLCLKALLSACVGECDEDDGVPPLGARVADPLIIGFDVSCHSGCARHLPYTSCCVEIDHVPTISITSWYHGVTLDIKYALEDLVPDIISVPPAQANQANRSSLKGPSTFSSLCRQHALASPSRARTFN